MARPGPKPVDVKRLELEAMQWACFFYTLRDRQPGYMQPFEYSPEQKIGTLVAKGLIGGNPSQEMRKHRTRVGRALGPAILIPVLKGAEALPEKMQGFPFPELEAGRPIPGKNRQVRVWFIARPVMPKREVWDRLAEARGVSQIEKAARGIGNLRYAFGSSLEEWAQRPSRALCHYAEGVRDAMELPHYPKTARARSDDKRVVFLAKVMAGLTLGLAPITAVKRLSHWSWPKDWAERSTKEFVERQRQYFSKEGGEASL